MSQGGDIWYQMRPNKFVDRRLFMELLTRAVPPIGAASYIYASMGGSHLVDHYSVYQRVGVKSLFSFDENDASIDRQLVNQPLDSCICQKLNSNQLPGELEVLLDVFAPATNFVIWLDYTSADRFQQLSELEDTLGALEPGDICRVTLNSDHRNIGGSGEKWRREGFKTPAAYRAQKLRTQLGKFYASGLKQVAEDEVPLALSRAVKIAASAAAKPGVIFTPVLLTTYKDAQRMFTATLYAHREGDVPSSIESWEYLPENWDDIVDIAVPELSVREKIIIDAQLSQEPREILQKIPFVPAEDDAAAVRALSSYKQLHRFVPDFQHVDLQ